MISKAKKNVLCAKKKCSTSVSEWMNECFYGEWIHWNAQKREREREKKVSSDLKIKLKIQ